MTIEEAAKALSRVGAECTSKSEGLSTANRKVAQGLAEEAAEHHRLRGCWSVDEKMVCMQLLDRDKTADWQTGRVSVLPWGWSGGVFGGSLTLTAYLWGPEKEKLLCRAAIPYGDPFLDVVRGGSFRVVVMHGKTVVRADDVDYSATQEGSSMSQLHVDGLQEAGAQGYFDEAANFWETLHHQTVVKRYLSATDRLSLGWFDRVRAHSKVRTILDTISKGSFGEVARRLELDQLAIGLVEAIETCDGDFRVVRDYLLNAFHKSSRSIAYLVLNSFKDLPDGEEGDYPLTALHAVMHTFIECADVTGCGRKFPWLSESGELKLLDLKPHDFPACVDPREYWMRQLGGFVFGWGHLLGGGDVPVSGREVHAMMDQLPSCEDVQKCEDHASFLLAEADANKQGCIPPQAVVQLAIGPFTSVELCEKEVSVCVALRQPSGLVFYFTVEPKRQYSSALLVYEDGDAAAEERTEKAQAALKLLISAVIRDFWVIERREAVFEQRTVPIERNRKDGYRDGVRMVYLPRVKYDYKRGPDLASCEEQLSVTNRRSHVVAGHLRKSSHPSQHQLSLAIRYGFEVPEGYTFVRPHERGKAKRDVIYRSRSALRSLYTAADSEGCSAEVDWFRFERDVHSLMTRLGFDVEHVAASGLGDHGVDVFATKGIDLDAVQWIVQCKCWKPKRKVSPSVVRELAGTLRRYPQGTRGMIVTTSGFTSGAVEEARLHDIRLMDGAEFAERLGAS
ncbi:restriction endonuclease [Botrimarina sp.]|uniref:restriction endonuclease n=1 Tax=Botrimarina sp. TaxID=2795802 RepID=UPI0032EDA0AE